METTHEPSLVDLAQILFASPLQPLDHLTIAQIHGTVSQALEACRGELQLRRPGRAGSR
jgi:hypothetical protein